MIALQQTLGSLHHMNTVTQNVAILNSVCRSGAFDLLIDLKITLFDTVYCFQYFKIADI